MKTNNIFEQNQKKTIFSIVFSALLIIDITAANLYKHFLGNAFHKKKNTVLGKHDLLSNLVSEELLTRRLGHWFFLQSHR